MKEKQHVAHTPMEGPAAPKDPIAKRNGFYIMYESVVEGTIKPGGIFSKDIYLEGRLVDQARYTGGVEDEAVLELLKSTSGFRKLVHSIGISVRAEKGDVQDVQFSFYQSSNGGQSTRIAARCPADGSETVLALDDFEWSAHDTVPGRFVFEFEHEGDLAIASVVLYLNEGYHVPEVELEPPVEYDTESYQQMIKRSLLNRGNNKRLKAAIEKARRGEEVTIAYIGGSITQGAGAAPIHSHSYVYRSYEQFGQMFGVDKGSNIRLIKAGLGGTPSELGLVRYERDVQRHGAVQPDIVIIEFAVNDAGDETKGNCYESLALMALQAANHPAVILLFSVFVNDWNLQDRLAPVGWHYDLPMVSVKDAVVEQFRLSKSNGNIISKKQFFYDIYHPANAGHQVMADCIGWLFAETDRAPEDKDDIITDKPPVIGNDFVHVRLMDRSTHTNIARIEAGGFTETDTDLQMAEMDDHSFGSPQFPNNWMRTANSGIGSFNMTITSKRLLLVFKDSGRADFGTAEIRVDGKLIRTADPHENNWTHCNAVIVYSEDEAREHQVEIGMAPGHEGKSFTILGFGYVL